MKKAGMMAFAIVFMGLATAAHAQNTWSPGGRAHKATNWAPQAMKTLDRTSRVAPALAPKAYKPHATVFRGGVQAGKVIEKKLDLGGKLYNATTRK